MPSLPEGAASLLLSLLRRSRGELVAGREREVDERELSPSLLSLPPTTTRTTMLSSTSQIAARRLAHIRLVRFFLSLSPLHYSERRANASTGSRQASTSAASSSSSLRPVYIVGAARTPVGSFQVRSFFLLSSSQLCNFTNPRTHAPQGSTRQSFSRFIRNHSRQRSFITSWCQT